MCPREAPAPPIIPGQRPEHLLARLWIERAPEPGRVLMDAAAIAEHNARVRKLVPPSSIVARIDLLTTKLDLPRARFEQDLSRLARAISRGKRVRADGRVPRELVEKLRRELKATRPVDELRVALRSTPLRCYPDAAGLFESARDRAFDLAQCAELRFGEALRVLGRGPRFVYVHAAYGAGWVDPTALSAPLSGADARSYLRPQRFAVVTADRVGVWSKPMGGLLLGIARLGLHLPLRASTTGTGRPVAVVVVDQKGLRDGWVRDGRARLQRGHAPLSRAGMFERAFSLLHTPYGWGGTGSQRDCSRLLMDLFSSFGVQLPRNSRQQARAGVQRIDVAQLADEAKMRAIETAARRGIVLLYLPGHIMLYLGRDGEQLMALHQFSGYLAPCSTGGETMFRVNRATVTNLELGRGSSRRAFIQRITRLIVFGPAPAMPRERALKPADADGEMN